MIFNQKAGEGTADGYAQAIEYKLDSGASGYYYSSQNPLGIVLFVPGMNSSASSHRMEIDYFLSKNWDVFFVDYTRQSSDESLKGFVQIKYDVISSVAELKSKDVPIVIYALSAGGYASICAANETAGVSAVVTGCSFDNPNKIMTYYAKQKVGIVSTLQAPFIYAYNYLLFGKASGTSASEYLKSTAVPTMIIETSNDEVIPRTYGIISNCTDVANDRLITNVINTVRENSHNTFWLEDEEPTEIDSAFFDEILSFYQSSVIAE